MNKLVTVFAFLFLLAVDCAFSQNLTVYRAKKSVSLTTQEIVSIIKEKDLIYFETVSHDRIAEDRGLEINETNVILFEDPDLTSSLINCEQTTALDLPLKIMVWEENEDVYIGFIDPQLMRRRFMINGCDDTLKGMTGLIVRIINEALKES